MTPVQRHAELCYQECTLIKAILGIMYSGDWFAFVKEALNLRAANIAYKNMSEYIKHADAAAEGGKDKDIDEHFRSGVLFGDGINSLILSMLPSKVMTVSSCLLSPSNDELFAEQEQSPVVRAPLWVHRRPHHLPRDTLLNWRMARHLRRRTRADYWA